MKKLGKISLFDPNISKNEMRIIDQLKKQQELINEFDRDGLDAGLVALEYLTKYSFERLLTNKKFIINKMMQRTRILDRISKKKTKKRNNEIEYTDEQSEVNVKTIELDEGLKQKLIKKLKELKKQKEYWNKRKDGATKQKNIKKINEAIRSIASGDYWL